MLVPPGDAGALTAALDRFLSEPGLSSRLAAGAASRRDGYRWEDAAERYLGVYETVTGEMPRHARHHDSLRRVNAPGFSA
jgi:glycosyltransferase involved in cell wall biosynthesis